MDLNHIIGSFSGNQEDIIWGIRQRKKKKFSFDIFNLKKARKTSISNFIADTRTKLLASLVPDEVISNITEDSSKTYMGCLLFGDIKGLEEVLEFCLQPGKGGATRMTEILNKHVGGIVKEIMSFEGDVLKFSAHTFLAQWKYKDKCNVHSAINCALVVQKNFGNCKLDTGHDLQVKLTITAGSLSFALIGDSVSSNYVCIGQPINDIKEARSKVPFGDILVSPSAWIYVNTSEYLAEENQDGTYYKVLGIGPNWKYGEKYSSNRKDLKLSDMFEGKKSLDLDSDDSLNNEIKNSLKSEDFTIRPNITRAFHLKVELAKFIAPPVFNTLTYEEPIECLNEIRQIVTMSINLSANEKFSSETVGVIDECYKIICRRVREFKGSVDKASLMDKDITFRVMFGLRGFTCVAECKNALQCSRKCQEELSLMEGIECISIACTTGLSYCGIFGDVLRHVYTAFGTCVLKASKMTSAYPNRITCDRKTFLYSQLSARDFILLPNKKLAGITDQEPIYEYENQPRKTKLSMDEVLLKPLLGRDEEMKKFRSMFDVFESNFGIEPCCHLPRCTYKNCLIMFGKAKRGKTRFLKEIKTIINDHDVEVFEIHANVNDDMIPYKGIRSMFGSGLKFNEFTLEPLKRQKLQKLYEKFEDQSLICGLNDVFDVDFPLNDSYRSVLDKREVLKRLMRYLCEVYFTKASVISIDDADLLDEESWNLFVCLLETKRFFLIMTVNNEWEDRSYIKKVTKNPLTEALFLGKLGRIHQGALACQVLNVFALPVDLENTIQNNSDGNPGWIENFLITMAQSKKISVKKIDYKMICDVGLIVPPLYMIKRMSQKEKKLYKSLLERTESDEESPTKLQDQWVIYSDSIREKFRDIELKSTIYKLFLSDPNVPVCFTSKSFDVSIDVDPETTEDMNVLEVFDNMSYQEQYALKCASILGDPFTRRIFLYIWNPDHPKDAAEVIEKLFEKGIICCARGDFSGGGEYVIIRQKMDKPIIDDKVECYCIGLDVHDSCLFMPKYASCGFMRFKCDKFRTNTYKSIPDTERKKLHVRAAKFIQKETRRCVSCGCSYFPPSLACTMDSTPSGRLNPRYKKKKSIHLQAMDFEELFDYSTHQNLRSAMASIFGPRTNRANVFQSFSNVSEMSTSLYENRFEVDANDIKFIQTPKFINPLTMYKLKNSISLVRSFSGHNFMSCECHLILGHMYKRLKQHFCGSEQWQNMVVATLHYSKSCVHSKNYSDALQTVHEAMDILKEKGEEIRIPKWQQSALLGKLYSLEGIIYMSLDQLDEAKSKFLESMKAFGEPFPERRIDIQFQVKLFREKIKQKCGLFFYPKILLGGIEEFNQLYIQNAIAETLNYICKVYMLKNQWKLAELAAFWSLRNSLSAETSLIRICDSFANMLTIAMYYKKKILSLTLEIHALRYCHKKRNLVEPPELKAVARLYEVIFQARIARTDHEGALQIAYVVNSISSTCNELDVTIKVFSSLVPILLEKLYVEEATSVMREMQYLTDEVEDSYGKVWYYALVLCFHLETGYFLTPLREIVVYCNEESVKISKCSDAKMRLILSLWLWYLRNDRREAALLLNNEVETFRNVKIINNRSAATYLYLLEGTLLSFVQKINIRSILGRGEARKEIDRLIKKLEVYTTYSSFIRGRLLHLKAYYAYILDIEEKSKHYIKKCRKFCDKFDCKLELLHLEHSEKAWNNELSTNVRNFWVNHCHELNNLTRNEMDFEDLKLYSYTYPSPLFVN